MIKKLPIPYIYCILIGIGIGIILGVKYYVSLLYWGETSHFSWVRHFSPHFINYTLWGFLVPLVYFFFEKFPISKKASLSIKIKAGIASFALAMFHEAVSYVIWFFPVDWFGVLDFNMKEFHYVLGAFPSGFISRIVEYWIIYALFAAIDYARKLRNKQVELARMESQLAGAQLRALRLQLHPHFLFNTLNTISSLMVINVKDAQKMVYRLGNLLRSVLDKKQTQSVQLRDELEFAKNYLAIEQLRFQDRLSINFNIDDSLLEAYVPSLILQPLVENAIKHGFSNRTEKGKIEVIVRKKGVSYLELIVRDDGNGTDRPHDALMTSGIGLKNVKDRLNLIYKEEASFEISSKPGKGFQITLSIPILKKTS